MKNEITEPTVRLCWNESAIRRAAEVLRAAHLDIMAADVEAHLKPTIEEPTGDVIVFVFGTAYKKPGGNENWYPFSPGPYYEWPDLIEECGRTKSALPVVYRNEVELTELSTEVLRIGVGEAPADADEDMTAEGFDRRMEAATPVEVSVNLGRTYTKMYGQPLAAWETELLNQQYRREVAADVLTAMDVDQYLIDAVRNATPEKP